MKRNLVVTISLGILLILAGCQSLNMDKENAFQNLYPEVEFNREIVLTENPVAKNIGYLGSDVDLILVNQSSETITFQISKDVYLYTYSDRKQKWIEVNNKFEYNSSEVIMFPPGSGQIDNALVFVWPEIYDFTTPINLRIVTIGHVKNDEIDSIKTGAYFDIDLVPLN